MADRETLERIGPDLPNRGISRQEGEAVWNAIRSLLERLDAAEQEVKRLRKVRGVHALTLEKENERLRVELGNVRKFWDHATARIEAALALDRPRDLVSEGRALHEAEQPTDRYWLGWDDAMEQVVKALKGEGGVMDHDTCLCEDSTYWRNRAEQAEARIKAALALHTVNKYGWCQECYDSIVTARNSR